MQIFKPLTILQTVYKRMWDRRGLWNFNLPPPLNSSITNCKLSNMSTQNIATLATKQQQLTISISTINDTDYYEKGISIYFFCYNFQIVVQV
jgi:hypothetical protein